MRRARSNARRVALAVGLALGLGCSGSTAPASVDLAKFTAPPPVIPSIAPIVVTADCAVPQSFNPHDTLDFRVWLDLPYVPGGGKNQQLDLVVPRDDKAHPLVVLLHAGGWVSGDKYANLNDMEQLGMAGYAAAAVNYRFPNGTSLVYPVPMSDALCAMRFLRVYAKRFHIDPTRVAVVGNSAGAHIASMLGAAAGDTSLTGDCPFRGVSPGVSAVVAAYGPHDLRDPWSAGAWAPPAMPLMLGPSHATDTAWLRRISPITYIGPHTPPYLLLHGTADAIVPVAQSRAMYAALQAANVPVTYVELDGVAHLFPLLYDNTPEYKTAACTLLSFLQETLRGQE